MVGHFLKKTRNLRSLFLLSATIVVMVAFQNCAPPKEKDEKTGSSESASKSGSSASAVFGGGSGGVGFGGSRSGGASTSSSSSGGGVGISGSGSNGSSGGGDGGTGSYTAGGELRFMSQPSDVNIYEHSDFDLEGRIGGGKAPFKYQWYKDGQAITGGLGSFSFFADKANSYSKEGSYSLEVTDATGAVIRSQNARVVILEPEVGCDAGTYFTYTVASYDTSYHYFNEYFDGPRGKFILHRSYDTYGIIFAANRYAGLATVEVGSLAYKARTTLSCQLVIPRIHAPEGYQTSGGRGSSNGYNYYSYSGSIEVECRNRKLKLIANTCQRN